MDNFMDSFIEEVLLTGEEISKICADLGAKITKDYEGKRLLLVGLLRGSIPFMAELMKNINTEIEIDFMEVSSYHGARSTGMVTIHKDTKTSIAGRHVLLVEDIVDTGLTIQEVINYLHDKGAASIEIATLLDKPAGRKIKCQEPKYIGATIEPKFVVGFGLDYNQLYRNLNYVGVLKRSVYEK